MKTTRRNTKTTHYVFTLARENVGRSIEGVKYPRSYSVTALDEIYDEQTKENRVIRYVPGEKSIYLDEQTNQDLDSRRPYQILFVNGSIIVDERQKTLLEFIQKCNFNEATENRMPGKKVIFKEWKPEVSAEKAMKSDQEIASAKAMVYSMELSELISMARILDVDVNRKVELIRWDVAQIAGQDPRWFLENRNSPNTKRMHYLFEAIDAGIIKVTAADRTVRWGNGQAIVQAPIGVEPLDALVDLTFESEGELVYQTIMDKLNVSDENVNGSDVDTSTADMNSDLKVEDKKEKFSAKSLENWQLFDEALAEGIIEKRGPAHIFFKDTNIGKGRDGVIENLETDKYSKVRNAIIRALEVKKNS